MSTAVFALSYALLLLLIFTLALWHTKRSFDRRREQCRSTCAGCRCSLSTKPAHVRHEYWTDTTVAKVTWRGEP